MTLDLRQLRYFAAVAEEGHITRAAERLGIGQPPLSQQIKALEERLGLKLFRRKSRGVELTACGRVLFEETREILARLEQAERLTRSVGLGERGHLRIGVAPTAPFHPFVPRTIRSFRELHPDVSISLEECLSRQATRDIRDSRLDVAFVRAELPDRTGLTVHALIREPMVLALPATHPLAAGQADAPCPLAALGSESFIVYARIDGPGLFEATMEACLKAGFMPRIAQDAPRISSTLGLVAVGLGIAMVPASISRLGLDGVAFRQLDPAERPVAVMNLVHRSTQGSAVLDLFSKHVRLAARTELNEGRL